ncbi:MAG: ATP-binding protein [Bacteroidaceae bacterium]|nr:ATP-binding protein [Bacteroidaceae bacterium]
MSITLQKGTVLELPIKEIRTENKKSYFIVTHEGREHAIIMFDFQKDDRRTDTMRCMVKDVIDGVPVFIQDFSTLYRRFYTQGTLYPFTVRRDYTNLAMSYYEVADQHGFIFRLVFHGGKKLHEGQRIRCRVRSLIDNKLVLELVSEEQELQFSANFLAEDVLENLDLSETMYRWVRLRWVNDRRVNMSRENFKGSEEEWVLQLIKELDENMDSWIRPGNENNRELLDCFMQVCLYLLEGSNFLSGFPEQQRKDGQKILSRGAQSAQAFMQALQYIEEQSHIRYIDIQLTKMKKSGYLFQPDRRLRELMCIFILEQGLMEQKMQLIFDIIMNGNKEHWRGEPFRSAFIDMLDLYILETRKKIDWMANAEDAQGKQNVDRMIRALAIQLLLATETDDLDRKLNQSMLYRYLTYIDGAKKEVLLEKSFSCLSQTGVSGLDFGWNEVNDLTLMAIKLSSTSRDNKREGTSIMQTYQGQKAQLLLTGDNLLIQPVERYTTLYPQLPEWMNGWCPAQVMLGDGDIEPVAESVRTLRDYQKWWKEIEYYLFNGIPPKPVVTRRKYKPEVKDIVHVRVTGYDPENPENLLCVIEDDAYEGEGRINYKNFVRYNLRMDMSAFMDNDGNPYLLQAQVIGVNKNGGLTFSMRDTIWEYIDSCLSIATITRCVVLEKYKGYYLCVSEYGYSVHVSVTNDMPEICLGTYMEVIIDNIRSSGTVEASFVRQIIANFSVQDSFANLIDGYADGNVHEVEDDKVEVEQEILLDEDYVIELVHIFDRKAVLDSDYIKTYNLLNVARILSLLIEKNDLAGYFNERMKLLQMFQSFAINGTVNNVALLEQSKVNGDMIASYPLLQTRVLELQAIGCLDNEERNPFLWEILSTTVNERLQKIVKLVLSYNMLIGFNMFEEKEAIRSKLNEILNIDMKTERPAYFGREDQHTEFKTSLVYPADKRMKADLEEQTHRIMKVICGFLNAEGGTLYLGVNDEGMACGIDEELSHFKNGNLDGFDLHVRNNVVKQLGIHANSCIRVSYPEAGKKTVYALHIEPSVVPVKLNDICYVRQGSSTWPVLGEDLELFLQKKEMQRMQAGEMPVMVEELNEAEEVMGDTGKASQETADVFDYHDDTKITTSHIRRNAIHSWEDGFGEETSFYFHLMPKNEYMITKEECWDETLLSLAIHDEDEYIIIVYKDNRIVRIPVSEIEDKTPFNHYKRYSGEEVFFACPARGNDALLSIVTDDHGNECYRMDDVTMLKEGTMSSTGESLSTVHCDSVVLCDIIIQKHKPEFKKVHNLRETKLGNICCAGWGYEVLEAIQKLGIRDIQ